MSKIWTWIKEKPIKWIVKTWNRFELWVASWAPGFKTKLASAAGWVSMSAALLQEYISGIPLEKFLTGTKIAIISLVLFTLTFWFRRLANVAPKSDS